jgi:hypothetical protein
MFGVVPEDGQWAPKGPLRHTLPPNCSYHWKSVSPTSLWWTWYMSPAVKLADELPCEARAPDEEWFVRVLCKYFGGLGDTRCLCVISVSPWVAMYLLRPIEGKVLFPPSKWVRSKDRVQEGGPAEQSSGHSQLDACRLVRVCLVIGHTYLVLHRSMTEE